MSYQELRLQQLLGKQVMDTTGQNVGRIEEVRAMQQGEDWVIQEYLVGTTAILERLSAWTVGLKLLSLLGAHKIFSGYRIPWDKLDLTDPDRPLLRCSIEELKEINQALEVATPPASDASS